MILPRAAPQTLPLGQPSEKNILFIVIGILLFFNVYLNPACSKEIIHLTLDHLSVGKNNILGHLGAGRNEKYIGFLDPLNITRMLLVCYSLGMVQVFLRVFSRENLHHPL